MGEATEIDPESFPDSNEFLQNVLDGKYEFPAESEQGTYFLASEGIGLYKPESAYILLGSQENTTLELFGGRTGQLPGAINVDIIAEQGIRADLLTD